MTRPIGRPRSHLVVKCLAILLFRLMVREEMKRKWIFKLAIKTLLR